MLQFAKLPAGGQHFFAWRLALDLGGYGESMHMIQELAQPVATEEYCPSDSELAIVVLNYNTVDPLRDCLRSVMASRTDIRYQVYVVDNASTDGSREMVRAEFPNVHFIISTTNVGYSTGNNMALRRLGFGVDGGSVPRAKLPRYVLLLNPDTLIPSNALSDMVSFLDTHPQIGVAGPRAFAVLMAVWIGPAAGAFQRPR